MATELQIYDFENAFEEAVRSLLEANELTVQTRQNQLKVQSVRPRVQVAFQLGADQQHWRMAPVTGHKRNARWVGVLMLTVVNNLTDTGQALREFVAQVRAICSDLWVNLHGSDLLPYHAVNSVVGAGTSTASVNQEEGIEFITLAYNVDFNIRTSAWPDGQ